MNNFLSIQRVQLNAVQNGKVLKANDYLTYKTATEVIQDAKIEAELTIAKAEEIYQTKKTQGYLHGIEEGRAEFVAKILDTTDQMNSYMQDIDSQIVEVVVTAMANILGEFDDIELTLSAVKKVLNELQGQQQVTLRVVPEQTKIIEHALQEFTNQGLFLKFVADPQIQSGQCVLESDMGIIECSIDDQIDAIKKAMTISLTKETLTDC